MENRNKKTFNIPSCPDTEFAFTTDTYSTNSNTYVGLLCKRDGNTEPYCDLTVNLGITLDKGFAFIDVNNAPAEVVRILKEQKFIFNTYTDMRSGYVRYPLYRLDLAKIRSYERWKEEL